MSKVTHLRFLRQPFKSSLVVSLAMATVLFAQSVSANGVFVNRSKAQHALTAGELSRIKAEHDTRFGSSQAKGGYNTSNPWERKKQKNQSALGQASWGDCRDHALNMRNICYKQGRQAYGCERVYEARTNLCDSTF